MGEGIKLGQAAGASLVDMDQVQVGASLSLCVIAGGWLPNGIVKIYTDSVTR